MIECKFKSFLTLKIAKIWSRLKNGALKILNKLTEKKESGF